MIKHETWLQPGIPNISMQLTGQVCSAGTGQKTLVRGGSVFTRMKTGATMKQVEYMSIRCWLFFLLTELTAVYITPDTNVNTACSLLLNTDNEQQRYPDGLHIIAGDVNNVNVN